jgi:hypothetical protein
MSGEQTVLQIVAEEVTSVAVVDDVTVISVVDDVTVVSVGDIGPVGPVGPAGATGETGPAGPPGPTPSLAYLHVQNVPSAVWTINHNLGFVPAGLVVFDSSGAMVEGSILINNNSTTEVEFESGFAGTANLS